MSPALRALKSSAAAVLGFTGPRLPRLTTLEEIAQEGKEDFQHAGGGEYHYIPCLNGRDDWMHALTDLVMDNLQGWLAETDQAALEQSRLRALALGAKS